MEGGDPSDDGFLMTSGLKNASKCRECSKTLDVGTPAWYAAAPIPAHVWPQVSRMQQPLLQPLHLAARRFARGN